MENDKKIQAIESAVEIIEKLTPYMPPVIKDTRFLWLEDKTLYMSIEEKTEEQNIYLDRLQSVLKEELDFITEVKFIHRRDK